MGQLGDFTLDQIAGAAALIVSSLGGLLLIIFKSRCTNIKCCCGLWECQRHVQEKEDEEEEEEEEVILPPKKKNNFT